MDAARIRLIRNYLAVIGEEYEERQLGEWGEIERGNNDNVESPRDTDLIAHPFVLVETSRYGQTWITLHADADAAVDYHVNQEYADDWTIQRITDLRDLTEYRLTAKAVKS